MCVFLNIFFVAEQRYHIGKNGSMGPVTGGPPMAGWQDTFTQG